MLLLHKLAKEQMHGKNLIKHLHTGGSSVHPAEVCVISTEMHKHTDLSVIITATRYCWKAIDQKGKTVSVIISILSSSCRLSRKRKCRQIIVGAI